MLGRVAKSLTARGDRKATLAVGNTYNLNTVWQNKVSFAFYTVDAKRAYRRTGERLDESIKAVAKYILHSQKKFFRKHAYPLTQYCITLYNIFEFKSTPKIQSAIPYKAEPWFHTTHCVNSMRHFVAIPYKAEP